MFCANSGSAAISRYKERLIMEREFRIRALYLILEKAIVNVRLSPPRPGSLSGPLQRSIVRLHKPKNNVISELSGQ